MAVLFGRSRLDFLQGRGVMLSCFGILHWLFYNTKDPGELRVRRLRFVIVVRAEVVTCCRDCGCDVDVVGWEVLSV